MHATLKLVRVSVSVFVALALARVANADDAPPDEQPIQTHGFVSQGALLSSDNNYLAKTERGSLQFTEAGINFTKQLDDSVSAGIQLFARDLGPQGSYAANFDWLYLDYHWKDWLGLRAGRVKLPFGLYNDTSDIDAVQPVVLLPQSIYPATNREFLLAQTGLELYGYAPMGDAGALDYHAYLGTLYLSLDDTTATIDAIDVPYIAGGRVLWETPLDGLRVAASVLAAELDGTYTMTGMTSSFSLKAQEWLGSLEYVNDKFLFAAEYGRTRSTTDLAGFAYRSTAEHMYGMASYHAKPWLQTTLYYSLLYPDIDERSGPANHQHDAALCLRFDITSHWLFKLEGHFMRGTAALSSELNGNQPLADLVNQWWLLAAKTTVYF